MENIFTNHKITNLVLKWFENNYMRANPSACQVIVLWCRKSDGVFDLDIGNEFFTPMSFVKRLCSCLALSCPILSFLSYLIVSKLILSL